MVFFSERGYLGKGLGKKDHGEAGQEEGENETESKLGVLREEQGKKAIRGTLRKRISVVHFCCVLIRKLRGPR